MNKQSIIYLIIFFTLLGCKKRETMQGQWIGKTRYEGYNYYSLLTFTDSFYTDNFAVPYDTFDYEINESRLVGIGRNLKHEYKFELQKKPEELFYYFPNSDSSLTRYSKRASNNFTLDLLDDKEIGINLPKGNGTKRLIGDDYRIQEPLYFGYKNEELVINFCDSTFRLNNTVYKRILNYISILDEKEKPFFTIDLVSSKDIPITEINKLYEQLKIAQIYRINHILHYSKYDSLNLLYQLLFPLTYEQLIKYRPAEIKKNHRLMPIIPELPSSEYLKEYGILLFAEKSQIFKNTEPIQLEDLKELIIEKYQKDSILELPYYLSKKSNYQDYISLVSCCQSAIRELRNDYLVNKYGLKYDDFNTTDDQRRESRKRFPLRLREIDSLQYEKIKYAL